MSKNKILSIAIIDDKYSVIDISLEEIVRVRKFVDGYKIYHNDINRSISRFIVSDSSCEEDYHFAISQKIYEKLEKHLEPYIAEVVEITEDEEEIDTILEDDNISKLDLPTITRNCLYKNNINTITQLKKYSILDLLKIYGFGRYSLMYVLENLNKLGICLAPSDGYYTLN